MRKLFTTDFIAFCARNFNIFLLLALLCQNQYKHHPKVNAIIKYGIIIILRITK